MATRARTTSKTRTRRVLDGNTIPNGWTVIPIPGGNATIRSAKSLTERQRRPLKARITRIGAARFQAIIAAEQNEIGGLAAEVGLTQAEADVLSSFTDCVIWAFVDSWTLDRPLPATPDEVIDLPGDLYDALMVATAKRGVAMFTDDDAEQFTPQAVLEAGSPTGASGA